MDLFSTVGLLVWHKSHHRPKQSNSWRQGLYVLLFQHQSFNQQVPFETTTNGFILSNETITYYEYYHKIHFLLGDTYSGPIETCSFFFYCNTIFSCHKLYFLHHMVCVHQFGVCMCLSKELMMIIMIVYIILYTYIYI